MAAQTPIADRVKAFAGEFDDHFCRILREVDDVPPELREAVEYAALAPGKRIRPYIVVRGCEIAGGDRSAAWAPAAAVECVHAFSLVHDDLPALDNDDLRRGRPTCHRQFGEAMAILAGDALIVLAFDLLSRHVQDPLRAAAMMRALARAAGWTGMIGGQVADLLGEQQPLRRARAETIQARKTASLFEAACTLGALAGGAAEPAVVSLAAYGRHLGCAFQIADDLLDVTGSADTLGKHPAKDATAGKQTLPRCIGIAASRAAAAAEASAAVSALDGLGQAADDLRELTFYVLDRNY